MRFTIAADDEFLRVTVSGRDTDHPPSELCAAVLAESRKQARNRILIELDQKFALSPTSQFQLVTRLPKIGFTQGVPVRNFAGLERAKAWLRGEADAPEA